MPVLTWALENWLALAGFAVGIVGLVTAAKWRQRRVVEFSLPVRRLVFSNEFAGVESFDLRLNGKPVRDLFILSVRFCNTGTEVLREADFLRPLRVTFDRAVTILPAFVNRKQKDIPVHYNIEQSGNESSLLVSTELFEPGDEIELGVLYESDSYPQYRVDGRIVNCRLVGRSSSQEAVQDNYHFLILRKHKAARKGLIMVGTVVLAAGILKLLDWLVPSLQASQNTAVVLLSFVASFTIVAMTVFSIFDRMMLREWKEYDDSLAERRARLNAEEPRSFPPNPTR